MKDANLLYNGKHLQPFNFKHRLKSADADIVIMAAAVADYTPKNFSTEKIKKSDGNLSVEFARTNDILLWL